MRQGNSHGLPGRFSRCFVPVVTELHSRASIIISLYISNITPSFSPAIEDAVILFPFAHTEKKIPSHGCCLRTITRTGFLGRNCWQIQSFPSAVLPVDTLERVDGPLLRCCSTTIISGQHVCEARGYGMQSGGGGGCGGSCVVVGAVLVFGLQGRACARSGWSFPQFR